MFALSCLVSFALRNVLEVHLCGSIVWPGHVLFIHARLSMDIYVSIF